MRNSTLKQNIFSSLRFLPKSLFGLCFLALATIALQTGIYAEEHSESDTPKDAAAAFMTALLEGDIDRAVDLTTDDPQNEKIVHGLARFIAASNKLISAIEEQYGAEALEGGTVYNTLTEETIDEIREAREEIENGEATIYPDDNPNDPMHLVKTDEGWRLRIDTVFEGSPAESIEEGLELFEAISELTETFAQRVQDGEISQEALDQEFGQAMMQLMIGNLGD